MSGGFLPGNLVLACLLVALSSAIGPPKQVGSYQSRQLAKTGQPKKKFTCPVTADPLPFVQWFKDGETISELWTRFRINKEGSLRIRDIELEDAGKYVCKATNGFGSINVNYSLIVVDTKAGLVKKPGNDIYTKTADEDLTKEGVPPHFLEEQKMQRKSQIVRPVHSTVRLKCRASGNPRPHVRWIKDGHEASSFIAEGGYINKKWTLKLRDLLETDSGHYMCVVSNKHGAINFTYSLEVIGKMTMKPILIGPNPLNESVIIGGTASFLCKVKSMVEPHIQWLKRVDKQSDLDLNNSATIEVKGQKFVVLKTADKYKDADGFFLNKLVIKNVLPIDVGMYICMGANSMGYSFKSAFLTISDKSGSQINSDGYGLSSADSRHSSSESSADAIGNGSLPLIIAIPAVVAIVLVTLAIFILQRRRKCNAQSTTHRNTRFNAVPTQERETPVHTNPHMIPQAAPPSYSTNSRSTSDKMSKNNHSIDFYSDISSVSRCHHQQQPQPHTNQYGY